MAIYWGAEGPGPMPKMKPIRTDNERELLRLCRLVLSDVGYYIRSHNDIGGLRELAELVAKAEAEDAT